MPQLEHIFLPLKLAHHHLSHFHCREALQALGALPERQRCSAGVLLLIGRCLYELVDYARAAEAFEAARAADPLSLEVSGWRQTPLFDKTPASRLFVTAWALPNESLRKVQSRPVKMCRIIPVLLFAAGHGAVQHRAVAPEEGC